MKAKLLAAMFVAASAVCNSFAASDLVVISSVALSPNPITAGNTLTVSFTTYNQGASAASQSTTRLQVKNQSLVTYADYTYSIPALGVGASYYASYSVPISAGTPPGLYNVYGVLDSGNTAGQGGNTANDYFSSATFTISSPCSYSLSPASGANFGSAAANASVGVTTSSGCGWSANNGGASWITITSGSSGTGSGTVYYSVSANTSTQSRCANMNVAGQQFTICQSGQSCSFTLSPLSGANFGSAAANASVSVTTSSGCGWSANNGGASWITITSGSSGTGSGTVYYSISVNTSTQSRCANMNVAGQQFTICQSGQSCSFTLSPLSGANFGSAAANASVSVTTSSGCSWSADNGGASWITVTSGSSGTGSGTVYYSISANTSTQSRCANMNVAGQQFTICQSGQSCSFTLSPLSGANFGSAAANASVSVTTSSGCSWSADNGGASWITVTSGSSGTGSGTVYYSVSANTSTQSRCANMNVAGQQFTICQSGQQSATVSTPTFNPPQGTYPSAQNVIISCGTDGATIRYTLDGSDPTSSSTPSGDGRVLITSTKTLKARAFKSGMLDSAVARGTYTINLAQQQAPVITQQPGNQSAGKGGSVVLTAAAVGNPAPNYRWQVLPNTCNSVWADLADDGVYSGTASATLQVNSVGADLNDYQFRVIADNGVAPTAISSSAHLRVMSPKITGQACRGSSSSPVFIQRYPAASEIPIDPELGRGGPFFKHTWMIIHGRADSSTDPWIVGAAGMAEAILAEYPDDQVLILDWSSAASATWGGKSLDFSGEDWIPFIGKCAAKLLADYGFDGSELNLIGHSWGAYVCGEIATRMQFDVNSIVALDPARHWDGKAFGIPLATLQNSALTPASQYDADTSLDFASSARFSWAIHTSMYGSPITPTTASEAFTVLFDNSSWDDNIDANRHSWAHELFTNMQRGNDHVSERFKLQRLLDQALAPSLYSAPWLLDYYDADGKFIQTPTKPGYEGIIRANGSDQSAKSLTYMSENGQVVQPRIPQIASSAKAVVSIPCQITEFASSLEIGNGDPTETNIIPAGFAVNPISIPLPATGGTPPYTYTITKGSLPTGLSLTGNGLLEGVPPPMVDASFTVTVTDSTGLSSSARFRLMNTPAGFVTDTNRPTITISAPGDKATTGSNSITVSGKTKDSMGKGNSGVAAVIYAINGSPARTATSTDGFVNWAAYVDLNAGWNTFTAQSVDYQLNTSAVRTNRYFLKVLSPLSIVQHGNGKVSLKSGARLVIGKPYTISATPGRGFKFGGWQASDTVVQTNALKYTFVMRSNLTLLASFVDVEAPKITVSYSLTGQSDPTAFRFDGKASDNDRVSAVLMQINNGAWSSVLTTNGWTNWWAKAPLNSGDNTIRVCARDASGNFSTTNLFNVGTTTTILRLGMSEYDPVKGVTLQLAAPAGMPVRIEVSSDLLHWQTLSRFTTTDNSTIMNDPAAAGVACRFYRAVTE